MSAPTSDQATTTAPTPPRFTALSRILHWLTALLVFCALFIGFVMVNSVHDYATLVTIHKSIGAAILAVVVIRLANRITHRAPTLPPTVGKFERFMVAGSEAAMYLLLLAQPLVGWAMVSASGTPVRVFGSLTLPPIAPFNSTAYAVLRQTHSILAYLLVAVIAAHISAILLHTLALEDGMLRRMTFSLPKPRPQPIDTRHNTATETG